MLVSVGGPPTGAVLETDAGRTGGTAFESIFVGTLRLLRTVAAELPEGGAMALVLSTSVREPLANLAISNGLRPGLAMTAKTLAAELGPKGIRVVSVLPGAFATDRMVELTGGSGERTARARGRHSAGPDGRVRTSSAGWPRSCCLPAASYLTGTMISVDGGTVHGL